MQFLELDHLLAVWSMHWSALLVCVRLARCTLVVAPVVEAAAVVRVVAASKLQHRLRSEFLIEERGLQGAP